jgi:phosphoglycerate dehydrogenase-like enzyme
MSHRPNPSLPNAFRVALTADFYDDAGQPKYRDLGLGIFETCSHIECTALAENKTRIEASQLNDVNGVIVLTPAVTADTVSRAESLLAVGRFGVGYDAVDVPACTAADVAVFITAGAVDRSVAEATVGWMLALTHHLRVKDQLVRRGQWNERSRFMGCELRDRTFGAVGFGGIARATVGLLRSFGMREPLAYDPFVDAAVAAEHGVRLVELDELLRTADFISVHCPLTPQTRGLLGRDQLQKMKPQAYLINTARGGIVDEQVLGELLIEGRIAGAALDCFDREPLEAPHPLGDLDNVLFAPHSIAWTDELFRDIGRAVSQGMVDLSMGKRPQGVVNPEVFKRPGFQQKWARLQVPQIVAART